MKKIMIIFVFAVFLIGSLGFAHATSDVIIHLDNTGKAIFLGSTNENLTNLLPKGVYVENGKIRGETTLQTFKSGEIWTFNYSLPNSNIEVFLPSGGKVTETNGDVLIDGGNLAVYNENSISVKYIVEESSNPNLFWIFLIIFILLIFLFLFSRKFNFEKTKKSSVKGENRKIETFQEILNDRENKIIDILKEKGKIKSSQLRRLTDLPKSSFSRHVQELEKKSLIKRSGEGRNKFVQILE
ncbi:winged helix-turn-helix transcriptional regulator [archaeon]|nr:winged helix-turn-helix transcriptional regulator [archaeon]PJC45398.1 MAG: hypothetical protein CO037_01775 [Candidatus Pacearchaeota archaeon CG_4_9_14_0_2_um_filter_30_8]